jgi:CheY-like chemotaxis protein
LLDSDYVVSHPGAAPGEHVMLAVSDTGTGIAPEILEQIFEPFFTTKEEGKGSGLGLSMVFGFIKQSGGYITVDSALGQGTIFRLYLPRSQEQQIATREDSGVRAVIGGGETILVVEDNEKMRLIVIKQLAGLGYRVLAADTAAMASESSKAERSSISSSRTS